MQATPFFNVPLRVPSSKIVGSLDKHLVHLVLLLHNSEAGAGMDSNYQGLNAIDLGRRVVVPVPVPVHMPVHVQLSASRPKT